MILSVPELNIEIEIEECNDVQRSSRFGTKQVTFHVNYYFLSLHYLHFCVEHINCLLFATQESGAHFIVCVPIRDSLEKMQIT